MPRQKTTFKDILYIYLFLCIIDNTGNSDNLARSWSVGPVVGLHEKTKKQNQLQKWMRNDSQSLTNNTSKSLNLSRSPKNVSQKLPPWNNDTRVATHDFDELFQMQSRIYNINDKTLDKSDTEKYKGDMTHMK